MNAAIDRAVAIDAPPIVFRGTALCATKTFLDGTHRCAAPEETLARIRPRFRAVGLSRLADVTGLDRIGVSTAIAHRPNGRTMSNTAGKGFTRTAALVSGAMEAIELHAAENVTLPAIEATYEELAQDGIAIPPERLLLSRRSLFSERRPEFWLLAWDLAQQREVAVPYGQVSMVRHPRQKPLHSMPFSMGSNGLASGNTLIEATSAALLETIERDAVTCHSIARVRGHRYPKVRLDTVEHPRVRELLDRLRAAEVGTALYDCGVDTEVPVYLAVIYDRQNRHIGMYRGYGAHLDPEIAMVRAITEAVQSRLVYIAGSRDDYFRHDYLRHRLGDDDDSIARIEGEPATVDARERGSEATATFEGDLVILIEKLRRVGLHQVLLLDLTREEVGIPVVRVVVPGLEGYRFQHYRPGRRALAFSHAYAPRR